MKTLDSAMEQPLPLSYVTHEACRQAVKLVLAVWLAAYLLHFCKSIFGTLPLAIALVALARWHLRTAQAERGTTGRPAPLPAPKPDDLTHDLHRSAISFSSSIYLCSEYLLGCLLPVDCAVLLGWLQRSREKGLLVLRGSDVPQCLRQQQQGHGRHGRSASAGSGRTAQPPHHEHSQSQQHLTHLQHHQEQQEEHQLHRAQVHQHSQAQKQQQNNGQQRLHAPVAAEPRHHYSRTPPQPQRHQPALPQEQLPVRSGGAGTGATHGSHAAVSHTWSFVSDGRDHQQAPQSSLPANRLPRAPRVPTSHGRPAMGTVAAGTTAMAAAAVGGRPNLDAVWRAQVGSPVVEFAWEKLCGAIVQTWVYDTWWALLSPDREFPAEVRRLLHAGFGQLAARARRMDVAGGLVRDVCEALMAQLELYRAALEQLGGEQQLQARALQHAAHNLAMGPATTNMNTNMNAKVSSSSTGSSSTGCQDHHHHHRSHQQGPQQVQQQQQQQQQERRRGTGDGNGGGGGAPVRSASAAVAAAAVSAARERLLRGALRSVGGLHPAFEEPDGHYRALRGTAEALLGVLWPGGEARCGRLRPLLRELLATCVLRPAVVIGASPHTVNRLLAAVLPPLPNESPLFKAAAASASGAAAAESTAPAVSEAAATAAASTGGAPHGPGGSTSSTASSAQLQPCGRGSSGNEVRTHGSALPSTPASAAASQALAGGGGGEAAAAATTCGPVVHGKPAGGSAVAAAVQVSRRRSASPSPPTHRSLSAQRLVAAVADASPSSSSGCCGGGGTARRSSRAVVPASTPSVNPSDAAARAAAECSLEFERRVAANLAAEAAMMRRRAAGRCSSSGSSSSSGSDGGGGGDGGQRTALSRQQQPQLPIGSTAAAAASPPPVASSAVAAVPSTSHGSVTSANATNITATAAATAKAPELRPLPPPPAAATATGCSVRKSASSAELRNLAEGGKEGKERPWAEEGSGARGASGGSGAARAGSSSRHRHLSSSEEPPRPQPQGLSASYHSGMTAEGSAGPSPERSPVTAPASAGPLGRAAGGNAAAGGGGGSRKMAAAVGLTHRRSCSYDATAARDGDGGGDSAGGGGAGPSFSMRGAWYDFDFGGGRMLPWQKASPEPPPPPQQQQQLQQQQSQHFQTRPGAGSPQRRRDSYAGQQHLNPSHQHQHQAPPDSGGATWCRASVATFEMVSEPQNFCMTAEYVVYKIRVADVINGREWTVARRFRSFEAMAAKLAVAQPRHRALVLALPPKRLFFHSADVAFVNSRRAELDAYLQQLLATPELATCRALREFLLPDAATAAPGGPFDGGSPTPTSASSSPLLMALPDHPPATAAATSSSFAVAAAAATATAVAARGGGGSPAAASRRLLERMAEDLRGLRLGGSLSHRRRPSGQQQSMGAAGRVFPWLGSRGRDGSGGGAAAAAGAEEQPTDLPAALPPPRAASEEFDELLDELGEEEFDELSDELGGEEGGEEGEGVVVSESVEDQSESLVTATAQGGGGTGGGFRFGLLSWGTAGAAAGSGNGGGSFAFPSVRSRLGRRGSAACTGFPSAAAAAAPPPAAPCTQPLPLTPAASEQAVVEDSASRSPPNATDATGTVAGRSPSAAGAGDTAITARQAALQTSPLQQQAGGGGGGGGSSGATAAADASHPQSANAAPPWLPLRPSIDVVGQEGSAAAVPLAVDGSEARSFFTRTDAPASVVRASVSVPNSPVAGHGGGSDGAAVGGDGSAAASGVAGAGGSAAGISAPLYELVDVLFGLQGQGFFRRQVISVARQVLSLLAGDAIDTFLAARLRHLTSEHSIARALLMLHGALFPGGAWYSFGVPPSQPQPQDGSGGAAAAAVPRWRPNPPIRAETYLEPGPPPPEAEQLAERVRSRLFSRPPPALLVNLVGARGYGRVLGDVWGLAQSRTLLTQLVYELLHAVLVRLVPELRIQLGGLTMMTQSQQTQRQLQQLQQQTQAATAMQTQTQRMEERVQATRFSAAQPARQQQF